jgi:hypothetical protein
MLAAIATGHSSLVADGPQRRATAMDKGSSLACGNIGGRAGGNSDGGCWLGSLRKRSSGIVMLQISQVQKNKGVIEILFHLTLHAHKCAARVGFVFACSNRRHSALDSKGAAGLLSNFQTRGGLENPL